MDKQSSFKKIKNVVENDLCMGCGFCEATCLSKSSISSLKLEYNPQQDQFLPTISSSDQQFDENQNVICPGIEMDMPRLSLQKFDKLPADYLLGEYKKLYVGHSTDKKIHELSASGGVVPTILKYLFEQGKIDCAYVMTPGTGTLTARGRIIRTVDEIEKIHGSVYHPFNFGSELKQLFAAKQRFAFVGLPCHIAGLEMVKATQPTVKQNNVISIGLFCGGVNKFQGIAYYLKFFDVLWDKVKTIEYRFGPWPGKIKLLLTGNEEPIIIPRIRGNSRWKILRYVIAFQGYWMLKRCRICPDQVSDFADIAVGDPHLPKYRKPGGHGFSAIVCRSKIGLKTITDLFDQNKIIGEEVSRNTIVNSQGYTLDNRKHIKAYLNVNKFWGDQNPNFKIYPEANANTSFRHYVYAVVDLTKIKIAKFSLLKFTYMPWQIFEYLFITFTPRLVITRLFKVLRNK